MHKIAWEYRNGWRNTDSPRRPNDDEDAAAATREESDTPTHDTNKTDVDLGEDKADLPRISKFTFKLQRLRKIRPVDFTSVTESKKLSLFTELCKWMDTGITHEQYSQLRDILWKFRRVELPDIRRRNEKLR